MHAAKLENSPRLQRTHALLLDGQEHSTRDIIVEAHVCAVNSIISELRANGIDIQTRWKGRVCYYRMTLPKPASAEQVQAFAERNPDLVEKL